VGVTARALKCRGLIVAFTRRIARFSGYGYKALLINGLNDFAKGYQQAYQQKTGITLRAYGARAAHLGMGADAFEPNWAGKRKKSYGGPHVSLKCESVIVDRLFHEPVAFRRGTGLGSPESLLRFVAGA